MSEEPSPSYSSGDFFHRMAKTWRTEVASSSSCVFATSISFPLESIKTRIQSSTHPSRFNDCVREVWKTEGFRGFWRGVAAPVVSVTVVRTFSFSVYQRAKYKSSAFIGNMTGEDPPLVVVNKPGSVPDLGTISCFGFAGAVSGFCSTFVASTDFVTGPFELTKSAMVIAKQIANNPATSKSNPIASSYQNKNTFRTAKEIVKNCGVMGLYAGFQLQIIRETCGTAFYFMTYESAKQLIVKYQGVDSPTSPIAVALAGGFCGMASLVSTYPVDRAKTAYQAAFLERGKNRNVKVPRVEYFKRASYHGLGVAAARSALTNAILFSLFEHFKKHINNLQ